MAFCSSLGVTYASRQLLLLYVSVRAWPVGSDAVLPQVLFRFFALWPAYACGAEQFPDSRIMMYVWLLVRILEWAGWGCLTLMPLLEKYKLCNSTVEHMCKAIAISWPVYYGLSAVYFLWLTDGGGGAF